MTINREAVNETIISVVSSCGGKYAGLVFSVIIGWIFLAGAVAFVLTDSGVIQIEPRFVWAFVAVGTVLSFVLEWRYATRLGQ